MVKSTGRFNILHIDTEKRIGGGEKQLKLLVEHLPPEFNSFIAIRRNSDVENVFKTGLHNVIKMGFHGGLDPLALAGLVKFVLSKKIDIIHAHTGMGANYAILLKPLVKAVVATRRVDFPLKGLFSKIKYRLFDRVVVVSKEIEHKMGDLPNLAWIESAVDDMFYECPPKEQAKKMLHLSSRKRYICSVGKIDTMKAQDVLIKALSMLKHKDVNLIIAGEGNRKELIKLSERLGVSDRVIFTGFLDDPRSVYAASELCVVASRFGEGSQGALKEALSCGIPVVSTAIGSAKYLINSDNGILVKPDDAESMAKAIERLLDKPLAVNIQKNRFSPKRMALRYAELYRELLGN